MSNNYDVSDEVPQYKHHTDKCVFLGRYVHGEVSYDLYYKELCEGFHTVMARYGNKRYEYLSGLSFVQSYDVLKEAYNRALSMGIEFKN